MAITDSGTYIPPTSGAQHYNTMAKPAVGGSYVDGVFGETVRRVSDTEGVISGSQNYSFNCINADNTMCFGWTSSSDLLIRDFLDGSTLYSGSSAPSGLSPTEVRWHPTDPDKYFFFDGSILKRRNLAAGTNTDIFTAGSALQGMGGSVNYCDRTARYWVLRWGDNIRAVDVDEGAYTGNIGLPSGSSWAGMSPDGNRIVTLQGNGAECRSFLLDHGANTVDTTGVMFWDHANHGSDHGSLVEGTDGNTYLISFVWQTSPSLFGIIAISIHVDRAAMTDAQQAADRAWHVSVPNAGGGLQGHTSAAWTGANKSWIFFNGEDSNDTFDQNPNTISPAWNFNRQEIIAVEVPSGNFRRLCHHRSRSVGANYYYQPRVSCSPDGGAVYWLSNFNDSTPTGYSDHYGILNPLGGGQTVTPSFGSGILLAYVPSLVVTASSLSQEGYRWRNDDGTETSATWAAAQDTLLVLRLNEERRLRVIIDATVNEGSKRYRLEYKLSTDSEWRAVESGTGAVRLSNSGNLAAGGEDTTFQLTPPEGKTSGDFVTGRAWGNENGLDYITVGAGKYTELEWAIVLASPAAQNQKFEFRVTRSS